MLIPETEIEFHLGISAAVKAMCRARVAWTGAAGRRTPSGLGTPSRCRSATCRRAGCAPRPTLRLGRRRAPASPRPGVDVMDVVMVPKSMSLKRCACPRDCRSPRRSVRPRPGPSGHRSPAPTASACQRPWRGLTAGGDDLLEALVRVDCSAEAGEHSHGPEPRPVHGGVHPTGVGEQTGELSVLRSVDRVQRDPDIVANTASRLADASYSASHWS